MNFFQKTIFLVLVGLFGFVGIAQATVIQNNISASASTGGNSSGEGSAGKGQASVSAETVIDGEVVQQIEEHKESENGESVNITKKLEYKSDNVNVGTDTEAAAQTSRETENQEEQNNIEQTQEQVEGSNPAEDSESNQTGGEADNEEQTNNESKPLIVSIVEFFRNIFSRFFA